MRLWFIPSTIYTVCGFCDEFIKITNHKKMHSHVKAKKITTDCY